MATHVESPPQRPAAARPATSEVVALAVVAGSLLSFAVVALVSVALQVHPASVMLGLVATLGGPTVALVVTRAQVRRRATDLSTLNLDAYVGTGIVVALLALPSMGDAIIPGPVGVMSLGFVAVGVLRREAYLAATALAAFLATGPVDLTGPLRADDVAGAAQVATLAVTAAAVAGLAVWRFRTAARSAAAPELAMSEPA